MKEGRFKLDIEKKFFTVRMEQAGPKKISWPVLWEWFYDKTWGQFVS